MAVVAIDLYHELLTDQPIVVSVTSNAALRVTLDQFREEGRLEEVTPFMDRFMENLDKLVDEAYPDPE